MSSFSLGGGSIVISMFDDTRPSKAMKFIAPHRMWLLQHYDDDDDDNSNQRWGSSSTGGGDVGKYEGDDSHRCYFIYECPGRKQFAGARLAKVGLKINYGEAMDCTCNRRCLLRSGYGHFEVVKFGSVTSPFLKGCHMPFRVWACLRSFMW